MKKYFLLFISVFFVILTSCSDVIFHDIKKEVELESSDISGGAVNCIVRFGDYLYSQNGKIYKKDASLKIAHNWIPCLSPKGISDLSFVNKLAADSKYIYAQLTLVNEDSEDEELKPAGSQIWYSEDGNTWKGPVIFTTDTGVKLTNFPSYLNSKYSYKSTATVQNTARLFCTNSISNANRHSYLVYEGNVFELSGDTPILLKVGDKDLSKVPTISSRSCVYFKDGVYFSNSPAFTTNESSKGGDETCMYTTVNNNISYSTDGSIWQLTTGSSYFVYSLAVTKDYLYLGTSAGLEHIAFQKDSNGSYSCIPGLKTVFSTNAESTLSSYYDVICVLSMTPENVELGNVIYGSMTFSGMTSSTSAKIKNCGLWSFIPSRGSWNRE